MNEVLKLKSIYELLNNEEGKSESFFIPSYQRGYRWTKQQVVELLEDIWEFTQDVELNKNTGFYCLQPIVVKQTDKEEFNWDIIDGQQRLTTIYILLKYFEKQTNTVPYTIGYQTREESQKFLKGISNTLDETNIDFYHMSKTFITIQEWFKDKDFANINLFLTRLLQKPNIDNNIDKAKNIRIIWYEIDNTTEQDDIEIFTRINMGKIPLTNAELIKALIIQLYGNENKNKQFELASEWDLIEYALQNDEFWYFINKDKNEKATRIEFIFELIAAQYIKDTKGLAGSVNKSVDKYYEFHIINHYLQHNLSTLNEKNQETRYQKFWSEVKNYFRILNEWYEDREFFHKIGFLVIYSQKTTLDFIVQYMKLSSTKTDFRDFLDKQIKEIFKEIIIEELNYEDGESVRKVLLMFNILTILENKKSNMRFQFDRYKKQKWDIEHIRSQTDKYPKTKEEKETWIDDILKIDTSINKTQDEILEMRKEAFQKFFNEIQNVSEGDEGDFDKHSIGNLTLLDSTTNRSYGNAFFQVKRKTIIENDKNGTFIPICTRNLFLKYYSNNVKSLQKWTRKDAESYKNAIVKSLKKLFENGVKDGA